MTINMKTLLFIVLAVGTLALVRVNADAQSLQQRDQPDVTAPLDPLSAGVTADQLFTRITTHNELRSAALRDYAVSRTYQVVDLKGKVHAEEIGRMEYRAPDKKTFTVTSESGSVLVRRLALSPLIASEIEAATGEQHHDSSISPANYTLHLLGEQQVGPYHCYVAQAVPKRKDKYLFEGKIWIDTVDYAIVRIEGHPAKKLSFWIEQADFVRQYEKIDQFWLSRRDETFVQVRLYGKKALTIDHHDYRVNASDSKLSPLRTWAATKPDLQR
jgi:outer membrane lipoprotein-sorting protein